MIKKELVRDVAQRSGYAQHVCRDIIDSTFDAIFDELEAHGSVRVPNFGLFYTEKRTGRMYYNSLTGIDKEVETKYYPKFKSSDKLKEAVGKTVVYRHKKL